MARIQALRDRRTTLRASALPTTLHVLREGPSWASAWQEAADPDRRREILGVAVERVLVSPMLRRTNRLDPDRVEVVWRPL